MYNKFIYKATKIITDRITELEKEKRRLEKNMFIGRITICRYDKKINKINRELRILEDFLGKSQNI